ncbi:MAG: hypothetical protein LBN38_04520 [Verrucomicrobiota bacterium]|jgi:hypothetical protein|nr:hypothetical protein [Verrucomicrobiota bacterium]
MAHVEQTLNEITVDAANLYREETYTDLKAGSIRKMVPVKADGTEDDSRAAIFTAVTQVMTPGGVLPLTGEVPGAKTLQEAVDGFAAAIQQAVSDLREEMAALQRERASQIVVPGRDVPPSSDLLIH